MSNDVFTFDQQSVRRTDSNSLLRTYDQAKAILATSELQQERARADRAVRCIAKELQKRKVTF